MFTLKNRHRSLLCKVYGDKSDDSAAYLGHMMLSYLLCIQVLQQEYNSSGCQSIELTCVNLEATVD